MPACALGGRGAEAVHDAIAATITTLPDHLRRTLTWDRGKEMARHAELRIDTGVEVYFADPHSPWQRGTNENTNGLLRQYFPKGTDLARWSHDELDAVAAALQQPATQDTRLEVTNRNIERTATLTSKYRCCDDRLNPGSTRPPNSGTSVATMGRDHPSAGPGSATTTCPFRGGV